MRYTIRFNVSVSLLLKLLLSVALSVSVNSTSVAKQIPENHRKLIIMGDEAFPPYEFRNDKGEADGFNIELIKLIMEKMGLPYEVSVGYWPDVLKAYQEGKVDVLTGLMYSNNGSVRIVGDLTNQAYSLATLNK